MTSPQPSARTAPPVTVVVASRNRRDELLASLARHEAPVVLVDNGSTDGTVDAVRAVHPEVTVLPLEHNLGARARTLGAEQAGTPFVAFADDDSWWAPGDLARAVEVMRAHPRLALLNARILVGPEERLDPVCAEMADSPLGTAPDLPGPSLLGFVACAALVRTEAFAAVGGFDAVVRFPGEEERVALDLAAAGWGLAYVDTVTIHHHPSPRRDAPARRQAAIWRSRVLTALMRHPLPALPGLVESAVRAGRPGLRGLLRAVPDVPAALRARRRVPDEVWADVRRLAGDAA
ncbi:glycosyltransferase family 2 protein [Geodermatophilus sabuli]|uniref:Glycosyltransferase, GT2 family n=1 Tax=Geodermatophilus sabuli TaxID=1564158 RepID=A0A285EDN8_9ACTN|nr:glycosyltransferase [Geodermatophilus sabuli]MBB3085376.1 GT2 family glycosyltransferase [Geodermatophilus sabuli]SNX96196.1 Glycosyltransferase, GT2 family [Geodermatophilus sabuli]